MQFRFDEFKFFEQGRGGRFRHLLAECQILRQHRTGGTVSGGDYLLDGACCPVRDFLHQSSNPDAVAACDLSFVRTQLAADQFHQRRFAAPIAAYESDSLTAFDLQADMI